MYKAKTTLGWKCVSQGDDILRRVGLDRESWRGVRATVFALLDLATSAISRSTVFG
jgi:hypothetical protein